MSPRPRKRRMPKLLRQFVEVGRIVRLLGPYARGRRSAFATGAGLTLLLMGLRLVQPWPLKWIVDGLTGADQQAFGVVPAAGIFFAVAMLVALVEYAQVMTIVGVGNQVLYTFRAALFRHVLAQPLRFHEKRSEGELLTRILFDTTRLRKGLNQVLTRVLQTLLTFVSTMAILFWVDPILATVMGIAGITALYLMVQGGHRVRKAARKNRRKEGKLAALVAEDLIAIRDVQTFRPDLADNDAFTRLNRGSLKQQGKVRRLTSLMLLRVDALVSLGIAGVLLLGAIRVSSGVLSAGELVLFLSYATALYRPFFGLAKQTARMGTIAAASERLRKLMLRPAPSGSEAPAPDRDRLYGAIELRGVGLKNPRQRRGSRLWALRKVDLVLEPGDRVAVLGSNGAGKSSLLRLVLRLMEPQKGELFFDGQEAADFPVKWLRNSMSVVLQGTVMFGLSVRDNLAIGRPDAQDDEILAAAKMAGADMIIQQLPEGLDTPIRRSGSLSEGERQKLALARALLRDGSVWLLDEPTSGLDEASDVALTAMLERVTRGKTTLWVTHDPRTAALLERVIMLVDGQIRFAGSRQEFRDWWDDKKPGLEGTSVLSMASAGGAS